MIDKKILEFLDNYCEKCEDDKEFRLKNKNGCTPSSELFVFQKFDKKKITINKKGNYRCKDFKSAN